MSLLLLFRRGLRCVAGARASNLASVFDNQGEFWERYDAASGAPPPKSVCSQIIYKNFGVVVVVAGAETKKASTESRSGDGGGGNILPILAAGSGVVSATQRG